MKTVFLVLLVLGGYYAYKKYFTTALSEDIERISLHDVLEKEGSISADLIQKKSKLLVDSLCSDEEILNAWGSSVKACRERHKEFEDMCNRRIFPDLGKRIVDIAGSRGLITRYRKCVMKE